jgi:hypothetical protein
MTRITLEFKCTAPDGKCAFCNENVCIEPTDNKADLQVCYYLQAKRKPIIEKPKRDLVAEACEVERQSKELRADLKSLMMEAF